ncbi:hypothetical protein [Microbacterium sp. USHLN272]|uniref:hypothetical protein n=1 Tax=Microbacterium sp. USHLN272 TaxID=3081287 RepID=UPI0030172A64
MSAAPEFADAVRWAFEAIKGIPRNSFWVLEEGEPLYAPLPKRMTKVQPGHSKEVLGETRWWNIYTPDGRQVVPRGDIANQIRGYDILRTPHAIGIMRNGNLAVNRGDYIVEAIYGDVVHYVRKDVWLKEFPSSPLQCDLAPRWEHKLNTRFSPRYVDYETRSETGIEYERRIDLSRGTARDSLRVRIDDADPDKIRARAEELLEWANRIENADAAA